MSGNVAGKSCEEEVCEQIIARRAHGITKYGVGLERDDLTELQWLQHAQEEAMDLAVYLQRLKRKLIEKGNNK